LYCSENPDQDLFENFEKEGQVVLAKIKESIFSLKKGVMDRFECIIDFSTKEGCDDFEIEVEDLTKKEFSKGPFVVNREKNTFTNKGTVYKKDNGAFSKPELENKGKSTGELREIDPTVRKERSDVKFSRECCLFYSIFCTLTCGSIYYCCCE